MIEYENDAYKHGYNVGKRDGSWLYDCPFSGRMVSDWLRGFHDGKNDMALGHAF